MFTVLLFIVIKKDNHLANKLFCHGMFLTSRKRDIFFVKRQGRNSLQLVCFFILLPGGGDVVRPPLECGSDGGGRGVYKHTACVYTDVR